LLLQALKRVFLDSDGGVLSAKKWWYSVPMLIEVRGDLSVSVCKLGLTMVALVVVEIWGEVKGGSLQDVGWYGDINPLYLVELYPG